jgi:hypothetical protein
MSNRIRAVIAALGLFLMIGTAACTWVKQTPAGATVREVGPEHVTSCEHLGVVSGTTTDRVLVKRNAEVIRKEQVTLAQNQAATIGGDTIVAKGPAQGATLQFDVYRCR